MSTNTNTSVRARLTALTYGDACIGEVTEGDSAGLKIFVPGTVPGELVDAQIVEQHERYARGALTSIIEPSPERVTPPCPYFGQCGGCSHQHIEIARQRTEKCRMVEQMLDRQFGIKPRDGVLLAGGDLPAYGYRRRILLHVSPQGEIGFYRSGTRDVVAIERCLLASDALNRVYQWVRTQRDLPWEHCSTLILEEQGPELHAVVRIREERPKDTSIREAFRSRLRTHFQSVLIKHLEIREKDEEVMGDGVTTAGHFSQVNDAGNTVLRELVMRHTPGDEVVELYAGAGNFSLPLARAGKRVEAVEVDPKLVEAGTQRALAESLAERLHFHRMSAEQYVKRDRLAATVVLDPPRSGARPVAERLARKNDVRRCVYVSCSLPTLGRDLQILATKGGFGVERVYVVDMFPQTYHVELVAVSSRAK